MSDYSDFMNDDLTGWILERIARSLTDGSFEEKIREIERDAEQGKSMIESFLKDTPQEEYSRYAELIRPLYHALAAGTLGRLLPPHLVNKIGRGAWLTIASALAASCQVGYKEGLLAGKVEGLDLDPGDVTSGGGK